MIRMITIENTNWENQKLKNTKIFVFLFCFCALVDNSFGYLSWERNDIFLQGLSQLNSGDLDSAYDIFSQLKSDGYEQQKPFLLFVLGQTLRKRAKYNGRQEDLQKALQCFLGYRELVFNSPEELKSAVVNIGYTYLALNEYQGGMKIIDNYLDSIKPNLDPDVLVCKAYLYNAYGFTVFNSKEKPDKAVQYFETAYNIRHWPLFANNLIRCYLAMKPLNCQKINEVYSEFKGRSVWEDEYHFTGRAVEEVCGEVKGNIQKKKHKTEK